MRQVLGLAALLALGLLIVGCQTLTKEECAAADWRVIGEQDGAAGHDPKQRFQGHIKACERAGLVPDQTLWFEGYQTGLRSFCTPLRGLSHGQAGQVYNRVCPPDLEVGFLRGYNLGHSEYAKSRDIRNIEGRIRTAEREIDDIDEKLSKGKIDEREGERKIRRLRDDIREWNRDIGRAEADRARIQRDIEYFRNDPTASTI